MKEIFFNLNTMILPFFLLLLLCHCVRDCGLHLVIHGKKIKIIYRFYKPKWLGVGPKKNKFWPCIRDEVEEATRTYGPINNKNMYNMHKQNKNLL